MEDHPRPVSSIDTHAPVLSVDATTMEAHGMSRTFEPEPPEEHPLLDVLTQDPICPVCKIKGTPISDDRGIAYKHDGRYVLCRVTPKLLERS